VDSFPAEEKSCCLSQLDSEDTLVFRGYHGLLSLGMEQAGREIIFVHIDAEKLGMCAALCSAT
jgi:hypothetical protein